MKKKSPYLECFAYLKESRHYIFWAIATFFVASFIGFFFSKELSFFNSLIRDLIDKTQDLDGFGLIWFIFSNNLTSAFFALFLGIFFGVIPLVNALMNGALVGYVLSFAYQETGSILIIWRLLPHGIFELPAIFLSIGLGLKLGFGFFETYFSYYRNNRKMHDSLLYAICLTIFGLFLFAVAMPFMAQREGLFLFTLSSGVLLFSVGLSFILFFLFLHNIRFRAYQTKAFYRNLKLSSKVFFYIIFPLLIIAAIIEGLLISFS